MAQTRPSAKPQPPISPSTLNQPSKWVPSSSAGETQTIISPQSSIQIRPLAARASSASTKGLPQPTAPIPPSSKPQNPSSHQALHLSPILIPLSSTAETQTIRPPQPTVQLQPPAAPSTPTIATLRTPSNPQMVVRQPSGDSIADRAVQSLVGYKLGEDIVALGFRCPERAKLHGRDIPSGYECILVKWAKSNNIKSPLVLGDPNENSCLSAGQFFALPANSLLQVVVKG